MGFAMTKIQNQRARVARQAASAAAAALLAVAGAPSLASAKALTVDEQSQVGTLVGALLSAAKALPADSAPEVFEGAFSDALTGYDSDVIDEALSQVEGTPGLPANAKLAAKTVRQRLAKNKRNFGTGALAGGLGGLPAGGGGLGFAGGGGGSGYNR